MVGKPHGFLRTTYESCSGILDSSVWHLWTSWTLPFMDTSGCFKLSMPRVRGSIPNHRQETLYTVTMESNFASCKTQNDLCWESQFYKHNAVMQ